MPDRSLASVSPKRQKVILPTVLLFLLWTQMTLSQTGEQDTPLVDLQLLLAVDVSGSIDMMDFELQRDGIASALRDVEIISAIRQGTHGQIAISLVLWSGPERPKYATPWFVESDIASADRFASVIDQLERRGSGGTGIGRALKFSIDHFDNSGAKGGRRVIDISGDGPENLFGPNSFLPKDARELAQMKGITINGLVILTDHPDLESYYREEVIVGDNAFVMSVESLSSFKEAMQKKLLREILPRVSRTAPAANTSNHRRPLRLQ